MFAAPQSVGVTAAYRSLKRELGATLALGWPIILANVAIYAMTATDFIMLGRLSPPPP
jgi:Na+-driven multidrug efflux pump